MSRQTRRDFLRASAAASTGGILLPFADSRGRTMADETKAPNERPRVGCIGLGGMGRGDAKAVKRYGDILAVCDVDRDHAESAKNDKNIGNGKADTYEDYRKLLDRNDIDVVTISTPDHWHTRIAIAALRAGKDVYCQKPLTLTIDEGKQLRKVVEETKRILQVGTQQRSEDKNMFLTAVAMVRDGRIGKVKRVTCAIGATPDEGKTFRKTEPPAALNWEMWLGQAPKVDYIAERCHNNFRWWYEYSGGKMTDWGAHHVDIAQWAIGMDQSGPKTVEVLSVEHPVPFKNGMPTVDDRYNTATAFLVRCLFPNDVELLIRHDTENGVTFEGEKGTFFVSRSKLEGEPVDELAKNPIPESALIALRKGKRLDSHMGNFIECVRDRATPVSDVASHHRMLTTCHLANIALRLGRTLTWDPVSEQIVGDPEANKWQSREQRKGYEINA
ncbi:Predicted dehydrogenase [Singulisphaera sp. GP187]|uniref:Gfo/Idh/MocA family protein n=1 Tax=Singulisphaera sp. GP187 TaxID=1882752 RepID=UPI00092A0686|nr:Gfo/Idh/MocA family oxidoreductase [Singulisphaera sp. GP187]SIO24250.1 Predicted dehydrogenase [Singulisphaera sp. GP187]